MVDSSAGNDMNLREENENKLGEKSINIDSTPWERSEDEILDRYQTSQEGLDKEEAESRIDQFGL